MLSNPPQLAPPEGEGKPTAHGFLFRFFLLTYLVTWMCWAVWAASSGATPTRAWLPGLRMLVFLLGVLATAIVSVWLTARQEGREGVRSLLNRLIQWRVGLRWYVFAVTYFIAIKLAAALLHRLIAAEWPRFSTTSWYIIIAGIVFSTPVQAGEEIGWRGYALPRLAALFGLGLGSIVLGIIWAAWHLPLFLIPGTDTTGQSFPVFLLAVTALSVAIAWLYARTSGSLMLAMLMHASVNNTNIVPSSDQNATNPFAMSTSLVAWIFTALLWVCAIYFLVRMRRAPVKVTS
ncbi:MAG TPA: type II CAAX endopeptidase family protein [Pyrinomonadaceae bacterium]|nr:type II CAAX endopeptidase family protein [Pyrinomonadaceae bacterium]